MATAKQQWADGPFKLVATPAYQSEDPKSALQDPYIYVASVMALNHNMLLRGLNSIYLQAPSVSAHDVPAFVSYALYHHDTEEEYLFPEIEKYTADKKFVEVNVQQHDAFLKPLESMETFLKDAKDRPASFSGKALADMILAFAPILQKHLEEEIPSLVGLKHHGDKLPIAKLMMETARQGTAKSEKTTAGMFFILNIDTEFEDGMWASWPPIPSMVRAIPLRAMRWLHSDWWKYASCDLHGKKKALGQL